MARRGLAIVFTLLGVAVFVSLVGLMALYFLVGRAARPTRKYNAMSPTSENEHGDTEQAVPSAASRP